MLRSVCKSKIHRATVTAADLNYEGSLTLDPLLMEAADLAPYERVHVLNLNTGSRFDTYIIEGERSSGVVCLNGPAARLGQRGDLVIIISYCLLSPDEIQAHRPKLVYVDADNAVTEVVPAEPEA